MKLLRPLLRRYIGLPPARSRTERASEWVAMSDGIRLETVVIQPIDIAAPESCLLVRSEQPLPCEWGSLFAEQGHVVVMQQCRGRYQSEGSFEPFLAEQGDGGDTVDWIQRQRWFGGRLGVAGFDYAGFNAWAALASRPQAIHAVSVGLAARDPHQSFYISGALQLEWALHFACQLAQDDDTIDLARGVWTRPILEADRVALRRIPWYRDWLEHSQHDSYWQQRSAVITGAPPPTLAFAGLYHPTLAGQLNDHAWLRESGADPELVVGPWAVASLPRKERARRNGLVRVTAPRMLDFFDRVLRNRSTSNGRVRVCVAPDDHWRESTNWPTTNSETQTLYLGGDSEEGRLSMEPSEEGVAARHFLYDPADARPSLGGASIAGAGTQLPIDADWRSDGLLFQGDPLPSTLEMIGPASVIVQVTSDAPCTDFTARLVEVDAAGCLFLLGEGLTRVGELGEKEPRSVTIELSALSRLVAVGSRLRLEIASASFPRFDRHPNIEGELSRCKAADARPAHQTLHFALPLDVKSRPQLRFSVKTAP